MTGKTPMWRRYLTFWGRDIDRDLRDEVEFHIEARTRELVDAGWPPDAAAAEARRQFGNRDAIVSECHQIDIRLEKKNRMTRHLSDLQGDIQFAVRQFFSQPLYSAVAVITLALGIGSTTAIFSIVDAVLLEPLPYSEPDRLFALRSMDSNGLPTGLMAPRFAEPLYEGHRLVESGALAWALSGSVLSRDRTPYPFMPFRVTDRFFNVFTDVIAMGRAFAPNEPAASIIISHSTWQNYFGSDPNILGSSITVDNNQRTVVGVTRLGFSFPAGAESWEVFDAGPALTDRVNFQAYLRLRPNATPAHLEAELAVLSAQLGPNTEIGKPLVYVLRPLMDEVVGDLGSTVLLLSGATIILLLIACVNVANLLLSRANARSNEIGLREALGAGRSRIVRQLMTESLLLCTVGGTLGVALAYSGVRLLLGVGPANLPRLESVTIDGTVLLFSAGAILLTTLLIGLAPALKLSRSHMRQLVDGGGRGGSLSRTENRIFTGLVIAEVALAVILVSGAGLLLHSYIKLSGTDPGVDSDGVLWMRLIAPPRLIDIRVVKEPDGNVQYLGSGYQPIIDFYHQLMDRIRTVTGVTDVTNTQVLPLLRNVVEASPEPLTIFGRSEKEQLVRIRPLATNFFSTMSVPILAGRDLQPTDRRGRPGVALVNEAFVRQYLAGENPLGKRLLFGFRDFQIAGRGYFFGERLNDDVEIVGVVPDIRFISLSDPAVPNVYMSEDQMTTRQRVLAVKTGLENPASLIPTLRREVAAIAPTLPVEFGVYADTIDASIARQRLGMALLAVFGAIALILAAVGIYGVMAYSVTQRTREIAVRAALGASSREVLGLVMRRSAIMAFGGVFLGLIGTVALRTIVQSHLYEISALDPVVLITIPLALLVIALFASFLPARRASRIDPVVMLRE
jgi:putative ABC transport system permease protein